MVTEATYRAIKAKLKDNAEHFKPCMVAGCTHRVGGVSSRYCGLHLKWHYQGGSHFVRKLDRRTKHNAKLRAVTWLRRNKDAPELRMVLLRLQLKIDNGPTVLPYHRYVRMKPDEKARRAWGRLRECGVKPEAIVRVWIMVNMAWAAPGQQDRSEHFRLSQIGRHVHILQRRSWKPHKTTKFFTLPNGQTGAKPWEDRRRQKPNGRYAYHLGKQVDEACEMLKGHCKLLAGLF